MEDTLPWLHCVPVTHAWCQQLDTNRALETLYDNLPPAVKTVRASEVLANKTTLQMVQSVTSYVEFTKSFLTLKMSYGSCVPHFQSNMMLCGLHVY
jgi:hypothetical protein